MTGPHRTTATETVWIKRLINVCTKHTSRPEESERFTKKERFILWGFEMFLLLYVSPLKLIRVTEAGSCGSHV